MRKFHYLTNQNTIGKSPMAVSSLFAMWNIVTLLLIAPYGACSQRLLLHSNCSATGDCSARFQKLVSLCNASSSGCAIYFAPEAATFTLEQTRAVEISGISSGFALEGNGAKIVLQGNSPFIHIYNCSHISIRNLTLIADRSPFTLGTVIESTNGHVKLEVDTLRYPLRDDWTRKVVAMHEIDGINMMPKIGGLDWIFRRGGAPPWERILLKVLSRPKLNTRSTTKTMVSFVDQGFALVPGAKVVLRHTIEFSRPGLDSIVLQSCRNVSLTDLTIHHSPGMGVLAYDCTNLKLARIINQPLADWMPLAGNADAIHIASSRGRVEVRDCVANRHGDDGLNIHSQYAVVQEVSSISHCTGPDSLQLQVGPHVNADNTSWGSLFAR